MKKKFFTEMYLHVGGTSSLTRNGKDMVEYDRTSDVSLLDYARREELPLYEVKSRHGVTLDITHNIQSARKVRDFAGNYNGSFIYEIPSTGLKRRVE